MKPLADRLAEARKIAADQEGDIRIKQLLRAMIIRADPVTGLPVTVAIDCHFKYWIMYFTKDSTEALESLEPGGLAAVIASWVQGAIDKGMLSLSNPPTSYAENYIGKDLPGVHHV